MALLNIDYTADSTGWLAAYLVASSPGIRNVVKIQKIIDDTGHPTSALLLLQDGLKLEGDAVIPYLMELGSADNDNAISHQWAPRVMRFAEAEFGTLRTLAEDLDRHLTLRSFLDGYHCAIADIALCAALHANKATKQVLRQFGPSITRWFTSVEQSNPWMVECLQTANALKERARNTRSSAGANYDLGKEFNGPQVTRFPPEPSGYLHIGHGKAALLNEYFAHREPGGTLICRFDDTNPSKESQEFQDSILEDLALINIIPDKVSHSSDYFETMYEHALELIRDGKAFADDSKLGQGDGDRKNRLPSARRDMSIADTMYRFAEMKTGSSEGQRWCLRARIAYDSPNGTLRDPVIYRCNLTPHHRTGAAWKIYPTYDFCVPILDSIEGVTLALRTNEYRDRNVQYEWFQNALGLRAVKIWDFSRMNFVRTVLSKRKLTKLVETGRVTGWDDPRMPTIRGIIRRGMTVEAFKEYILSQGPSKNILNLEWGALWTLNKKKLDPVVPRYTAIDKENIVRCSVWGWRDGLLSVEKPKHSKNPSLGTKTVRYGTRIIIEQKDAQTLVEGEEITLMSWGNAFVRTIVRAQDGLLTHIALDLNLAGDVKQTRKKLTWLAESSTNMVPMSLGTFDHLITKDKLDRQDTLEEFLTPQTEYWIEAYGDLNVANLAPGAVVQFERKGYYKLDAIVQVGGSMMMAFLGIPSGRKDV